MRWPHPDDKWWVKSKSKVTNDNEVQELDRNECSVDPQETEDVQVNGGMFEIFNVSY